MAANIQGIYIALFGRPADPHGLSFWNDITAAGTDLAPLIGTLTREAEYLDRFEGMGDAEIVNSIYLSLFGRDADPDGLEFFLSALESGAHTIETIAINILDGAQGTDLETLSAKTAAATIFTERLALEIEIAAYRGTAAADIGRGFLDLVDADTTGIDALADEWVLKLLPSDDDSDDSGGGVTQPPSFNVLVDDGKLTFEGSARGDVRVEVVGDELVLTRQGVSATLEAAQGFSGLADDTVKILSAGASDVFAHGADGWTTGTGVDILDFYAAVSAGQSTILLASGFNPADGADPDDPDSWPDFGDLFGDGDENEPFQTPTNLAVIAARGALTSLSSFVDDDDAPVGDMEIGLPIFLSGGADTLSVAGDQGFMLVGKSDGLTSDTLTGGKGNDILMAPNSTGTADIRVEYIFDGEPRAGKFNDDFSGVYHFTHSEIGNPLDYIGTNHLGQAMIRLAISGEAGKEIEIEYTFGGIDLIYYNTSSDDIDIFIITADYSDSIGMSATFDGYPYASMWFVGFEKYYPYAISINDLFSDASSYDLLTGGEGSDLFIFTEGSGVDVITDFNVEEDQLIVLEVDYEMRVYNQADAEGDGLFDDTIIIFVDDDGSYVPEAGVVVILGVPDFTYDASCGCG